MVSSSLTLSLLLLSVVFMQVVCDVEELSLRATSGAEVILPCSYPDNKTIQVVEWSKSGLGAKFVLLFRDGMMDLDQQHPAFKDRVQLLDSMMAGGDVSLVLKKLRVNDTGGYECRVIQQEEGEQLRRKVFLHVVAPFPPWFVILLVLISVALTATTFLVYKNRHYFTQAQAAQEPKKKKKKKKKKEEEEEDEDEEEGNFYDEDIKLNSED